MFEQKLFLIPSMSWHHFTCDRIYITSIYFSIVHVEFGRKFDKWQNNQLSIFEKDPDMIWMQNSNYIFVNNPNNVKQISNQFF